MVNSFQRSRSIYLSIYYGIRPSLMTRIVRYLGRTAATISCMVSWPCAWALSMTGGCICGNFYCLHVIRPFIINNWRRSLNTCYRIGLAKSLVKVEYLSQHKHKNGCLCIAHEVDSGLPILLDRCILGSLLSPQFNEPCLDGQCVVHPKPTWKRIPMW